MRTSINGIEVPHEKNTKELIAMLNCDMPLFTVVCDALSCKIDTLSFETLLSILKDNDPYKRRVAIECLGNHVMFFRAIDDIIMCLDDKSHYVVRAAIEAMKKHRVLKSHEKIIKLLKSKDESTRESAVSALEYISTESDFDLVLNLLNDRNKRIRNTLPNVILVKANKANWSKAYAVMKDSNNSKVRLAACKLLNTFGSKTEKDEAKLFFQDKDGHVRKFSKKMIDGVNTVRIRKTSASHIQEDGTCARR